MKQWQLQEAKARLSELVRSATKDGPQEITVRGKPEVVVISASEYERLKKRKPRFVEFMRSSPLNGVELDLTRNKSPMREAGL